MSGTKNMSTAVIEMRSVFGAEVAGPVLEDGLPGEKHDEPQEPGERDVS
jgi:hypothetical protein